MLLYYIKPLSDADQHGLGNWWERSSRLSAREGRKEGRDGGTKREKAWKGRGKERRGKKRRERERKGKEGRERERKRVGKRG